MPKRSKKKPALYRRPLLYVVLGLLIVLGASGSWLWHRHHQQVVAAQNTSKTATKAQQVTEKGAGESTSTTSTDSKGSSSSSSSTDTSQPLTKPTGTFVSNHKPGQNGSPLQESSVCLTTPGASCQIIFTNGSITKTLDSVTADGSGAAYWTQWTPAGVGLTTGDWTVTAKATLGQQTASTQDPTVLEIQ